MHQKALQELIELSNYIGSRCDYVQGGGGNISVKLDNELMAVKASGYRLNQVSLNDGYVIVKYNRIREFYEGVNYNQLLTNNYEKESLDVAISNTVSSSEKVLRPSVEVGFHSILKKYVIHSHSVYTNILCCSQEGKKLTQKLLSQYSPIWIPYINPGFLLTLKIKDEVEKANKDIKVILMENHGLIVTSDSFDEVVNIHDRVNQVIIEYFKLSEFPKVELEEVEDGVFRSKTLFLIDYIKTNNVDDTYFEKYPLYPDQLVYINSNLNNDKKIVIDLQKGMVFYKNMTLTEAISIEETMLAYFYVLKMINYLELKVKIMSEEGTNFIQNWESEKYRKNLLKKHSTKKPIKKPS